MTETNVRDIEHRLRAVRPNFDREDDALDTQTLIARAHRQIAARDMVGFGFAHLLRTILILFNGLYRQTEAVRKTVQTNQNNKSY